MTVVAPLVPPHLARVWPALRPGLVRSQRASVCKIRPDCRLPSLTRACTHSASVGIGPRRSLLWSIMAVSNHGSGLFVPKPTREVAYHHSYWSDLPQSVRGRPLASAAVCLGCYSFSYSPAKGTVMVATGLIPSAMDRPGDALSADPTVHVDGSGIWGS